MGEPIVDMNGGINYCKPFNSFSEVYSLPIQLRDFYYKEFIKHLEKMSEALKKK